MLNMVAIGPVKQNISALNCDYFLIHQFKHVFWVLKRTVSFKYPQHMFWLRNKKNNFQLYTLIWLTLSLLMLLTFANRLDLYQTGQNMGPDLVLNCLILWWNFLKEHFKVSLKKISSNDKMVWIQMRTDIVSVLTVCKHYQQTTKVAASKKRVERIWVGIFCEFFRWMCLHFTPV